MTLLVALTIGGCMGDAAKVAVTTQPPSLEPTASFEQGTGLVAGLVVDVEMRPIPAANVRLAATDPGSFIAEAASGDDGRFALTGLREGTYRLTALKDGFYESVPKRVEVLPNEETKTQIVLQPLPAAVPHHSTKSYPHFLYIFGCIMHMHIGNVDPNVDPYINEPFCGPSAHDSENTSVVTHVDERIHGELNAVLVEVDWKPTVTACKLTFRSELTSPQDSKNVTSFGNYKGHRGPANPYYWTNLPNSTSAPTRLLATRTGTTRDAMHSEPRIQANGGRPIDTSGDWRVFQSVQPHGTLGLPVDYSCGAQQPATLWISTFFIGPMPAPDWSATR